MNAIFPFWPGNAAFAGAAAANTATIAINNALPMPLRIYPLRAGTLPAVHRPGNYPSPMATAPTRKQAEDKSNVGNGRVDASHPGIAPDVGPDDPRRFTDSGIEI